MDRKFIDCITSFDSGFFVFFLSRIFDSYLLLFLFDFTMERRLVIESLLYGSHRKNWTKIKVVWNDAVVDGRNIKKFGKGDFYREGCVSVAKLALVSTVIDRIFVLTANRFLDESNAKRVRVETRPRWTSVRRAAPRIPRGTLHTYLVAGACRA